MEPMENLLVLLLAVALDILLREPPAAVHPVVWIGKVISVFDRLARACWRWPSSDSDHGATPSVIPGKVKNLHKGRDPEGAGRWRKAAQFTYGAATALFTIAVFSVPVYLLLAYADRTSPFLYVVLAALLLKPAFSFRELRRSALEVRSLLASGNLEQARARMPALVSRDAAGLDEPALVSATVESVAENTCDSFVAPLFYFLLLGVPGAAAYRVANTLDSMVGYHGDYEHLGKFAARLDDVLNFVPARISGLLIVAAACLSRQAGNAWRVMLADHSRTESPNAGWTMSAAAGALGIRLEKQGYYALGAPDRSLSPAVISSGVRLVEVSAILWVLACSAWEVMHYAFAA
ncbi:MAG: adenosylcobinamide-phosphate synthase CbiB [Chloroflexota bacterium]